MEGFRVEDSPCGVPQPQSQSALSLARRRALLLGAGDVLAILLFAGVGRASHHEPLLSLGLVATAAPFIAGETALALLRRTQGR